MTPERKAELRRLCEGATPGRWQQGPHYTCDVIGGGRTIRSHALYTPQDDADAAFIAASRTAIPELLDAVDEAEEEARRARDVLAKVMEVNVTVPGIFRKTILTTVRDVLPPNLRAEAEAVVRGKT